MKIQSTQMRGLKSVSRGKEAIQAESVIPLFRINVYITRKKLKANLNNICEKCYFPLYFT